MRKLKGFTLVELLVVIAIIGILATIGLVALNGAREKARDATRKSDVGQLKTALLLYSDDYSTNYPAIDGNSNADTANSIFDPNAGNNPVVPEYISKSPDDPTNNATYRYIYEECTSSGRSVSTFILYATLESPSGTYFFVAGDGSSGDKAASVGACTTF